MGDGRDLPEGVPPATEDIGLPTPSSPGRSPPPDLPPAPDTAEPKPSGGGGAPTGAPEGAGER